VSSRDQEIIEGRRNRECECFLLAKKSRESVRGKEGETNASNGEEERDEEKEENKEKERDEREEEDEKRGKGEHLTGNIYRLRACRREQ